VKYGRIKLCNKLENYPHSHIFCTHYFKSWLYLVRKNVVFLHRTNKCRSNKCDEMLSDSKWNGFCENRCCFRDVDSHQLRKRYANPGWFDSKIVVRILGEKTYLEKFWQLNATAGNTVIRTLCVVLFAYKIRYSFCNYEFPLWIHS